MSGIQPIILTPDLDRLAVFYTQLLGAEVHSRMPPQGPTFYLGLRIGDGELGLTADAQVPTGDTPRILIHIEVEDVDEVLGRVVALGGQVSGPANDMPWGQRVGHIKDPDGNAVNLAQAI